MNGRTFMYAQKKEHTNFLMQKYLTDLKSGNYLSAFQKMNELLLLRPDDFRIYHFRANLFALYKDHEKALLDYNECLRINPNFTDAYINRGFTKRSLGDTEGSKSDFIEAAKLRYTEDNLLYKQSIHLTGGLR